MLKIAAVERDSKTSDPWTRAAITLAFVAMLVAPGMALALDGIDLSEPPAETAEGECSALVQIKYPFLSCMNGEIGQGDADEDWENSRRMPRQSDWIEGDGYWGPSPN